MSHTTSFLAACVDQNGYAKILSSTARSPTVLVLSPDHFLFSQASVNGHPLERQELEEMEEKRRQELNGLRRRIVKVLGCEKTAAVLLDVADHRIRRAEIAKLLGINRCQVTREIQRLLRFLADNWPSVNGG